MHPVMIGPARGINRRVTATAGRITAAFVSEWTDRYRRGAATTRWRPGPKLREAMPLYPELAVLDDITNYWDLEEHIFLTIGSSVRTRGSFTMAEFLTVGYWKTPRQLGKYLANANQVVSITGEALESTLSPPGRRQALCRLDGVGVPVASTLLAAWRPEEFTIIDIWALAALAHFGEHANGVAFDARSQAQWESDYEQYLAGCAAIAERVKPLTLRDVDRALWKWGQLNAPR